MKNCVYNQYFVLYLQEKFGLNGTDDSFKMFESDSAKNLLFKDSTKCLKEIPATTDYEGFLGKEYMKVMSSLRHCQEFTSGWYCCGLTGQSFNRSAIAQTHHTPRKSFCSAFSSFLYFSLPNRFGKNVHFPFLSDTLVVNMDSWLSVIQAPPNTSHLWPKSPIEYFLSNPNLFWEEQMDAMHNHKPKIN